MISLTPNMATHYNICKKLSQLVMVISSMEDEIETNDFSKRLLDKEYQEIFKEISNYKRNNIASNNSNDDKSQYSKKYGEMKSEYRLIVPNNIKLFEKCSNMVREMAEKVKGIVKKISNDLENNENEFVELVDMVINSSESTRKKYSRTLSSNLEKNDKEHSENVHKAQNDHEKRLKLMQSEYLKEIERIKSENQGDNAVINDYQPIILGFKESIMSSKTCVNEITSGFSNKFSLFRSKMKSLMIQELSRDDQIKKLEDQYRRFELKSMKIKNRIVKNSKTRIGSLKLIETQYRLIIQYLENFRMSSESVYYEQIDLLNKRNEQELFNQKSLNMHKNLKKEYKSLQDEKKRIYKKYQDDLSKLQNMYFSSIKSNKEHDSKFRKIMDSLSSEFEEKQRYSNIQIDVLRNKNDKDYYMQKDRFRVMIENECRQILENKSNIEESKEILKMKEDFKRIEKELNSLPTSQAKCYQPVSDKQVAESSRFLRAAKLAAEEDMRLLIKSYNDDEENEKSRHLKCMEKIQYLENYDQTVEILENTKMENELLDNMIEQMRAISEISLSSNIVTQDLESLVMEKEKYLAGFRNLNSINIQQIHEEFSKKKNELIKSHKRVLRSIKNHLPKTSHTLSPIDQVSESNMNSFKVYVDDYDNMCKRYIQDRKLEKQGLEEYLDERIAVIEEQISTYKSNPTVPPELRLKRLDAQIQRLDMEYSRITKQLRDLKFRPNKLTTDKTTSPSTRSLIIK